MRRSKGNDWGVSRGNKGSQIRVSVVKLEVGKKGN